MARNRLLIGAALIAVAILVTLWVLPAQTSASTDLAAPAVAAATPTPTGVTATVNSATLNVRSGPGTNYGVIGSIKKGQSLNVIGRNANNTWLQVCCINAAPGWVSASLVKVTGDLAKLPVATPPAAAAAAAPKAGGAAKGVLIYSVLNKDPMRWELWQYDFATNTSKFLKEWRTEIACSQPNCANLAYFVWPEGGDPGIYTAKQDLSGEWRVLPGGPSYPSWSPDGGRMSATYSSDQGEVILIFNSDGSGLRVLGPGEYPAWSPKNAEIAHRACLGGACGIYVTNADTGAQRRLTTGGSDGQPAWSPNGQQLAYISQDDGNFEVYRINADGTGKQRLTTDPASDGLPVWSPDGTWVAFRSDRGGAWAIWLMKADGTGLKKLVDAPVLPLWFFEKMAWRP